MLETPGLVGLASGLLRVEKHEGDVVVTHFRLRPPWASSVIHLGDGVRAHVGAFAGRKAARRLKQAGFNVTERSRLLRDDTQEELAGALVRVRRRG